MNRELAIRSFPIELFKVLQIADWMDSGGQAKAAVAEGVVMLNGKSELQKRKKCLRGDVVQFNNQSVTLIDEV